MTSLAEFDTSKEFQSLKEIGQNMDTYKKIDCEKYLDDLSPSARKEIGAAFDAIEKLRESLGDAVNDAMHVLVCRMRKAACERGEEAADEVVADKVPSFLSWMGDKRGGHC